MSDTIFLICALNLMLSFCIYVKISFIDKHNIKKDEKNASPKAQPKPEISQAEKQRIEFDAKRKAEQWNNFFSYTGESQKKGGD